ETTEHEHDGCNTTSRGLCDVRGERRLPATAQARCDNQHTAGGCIYTANRPRAALAAPGAARRAAVAGERAARERSATSTAARTRERTAARAGKRTAARACRRPAARTHRRPAAR